jgi:hypothetical protein
MIRMMTSKIFGVLDGGAGKEKRELKNPVLLFLITLVAT